MRCFYSENLTGDNIELSKQEKHHIFSVLRFKPGEKLLLIDGKGTKIEVVVNNNQTLSPISSRIEAPPKYRIHLFIAPPRKNQMDQILSQSTELAVWSITPIITERSVALPDKQSIEKWKTKVIEACKQSHNPFAPQINNTIKFSDAVEKTALNYSAFFGAVTSTANKLLETTAIKNDVAWFIGPEGGFTECETDLMIKSNFVPIKIGRHIMRVETACIAGISLLQYHLNSVT